MPVNAIQVGGYDPCTITDFEIPKKYGLRQTIARYAGHRRHLSRTAHHPCAGWTLPAIWRTVCPDAWFLNYTNPMAMLTGSMQRYTGIKTRGAVPQRAGAAADNLMEPVGMHL